VAVTPGERQPIQFSAESEFSALQSHRAWQTGRCNLVQFWTNEGRCHLFSTFQLVAGTYDGKGRLVLYTPAGISIEITGPDVGRLVKDLAIDGIVSVRADGKGILSVAVIVPDEPESD
jgi:hypothetical protein